MSRERRARFFKKGEGSRALHPPRLPEADRTARTGCDRWCAGTAAWPRGVGGGRRAPAWCRASSSGRDGGEFGGGRGRSALGIASDGPPGRAGSASPGPEETKVGVSGRLGVGTRQAPGLDPFAHTSHPWQARQAAPAPGGPALKPLRWARLQFYPKHAGARPWERRTGGKRQAAG